MSKFAVKFAFSKFQRPRVASVVLLNVLKKKARGVISPRMPPAGTPTFLLCNLAPLNFALSCAGPLPHATRRPRLTHFSHVIALHDYDTPSTLHVWFPMRRILQLLLNEGVVFAGSR